MLNKNKFKIMKKVDIVTKKEANKRYMSLKDKAFAVAKRFGTLPAYCNEPECVLLMKISPLTQLKDDEACIFIDDMPADQLTDFPLEQGKKIIGRLCVKNVAEAFIQNEFTEKERLCLRYFDGIVEYFKYREDLDCWVFDKNSIGTEIKPDNGILN